MTAKKGKSLKKGKQLKATKTLHIGGGGLSS